MSDSTMTMPRVELEPFADRGFPVVRQAIQVSRLVYGEAEWLKVEQPGTFRRYERPPKAYRSVQRLAASETLQAYIIHVGSVAAVGLATVIRDQHVIHPTEGKIEGDDLDYWLAANQARNTHLAVVEKLFEHQAGRPAFATVLRDGVGADLKNEGFSEYMRKVGAPAGLRTNAEDHYEVARSGALSQVYQLHE